MRYKKQYIRKLTQEAHDRFAQLLHAIPDCTGAADTVDVNGLSVRLAVESFKAILAEIKKLK